MKFIKIFLILIVAIILFSASSVYAMTGPTLVMNNDLKMCGNHWWAEDGDNYELAPGWAYHSDGSTCESKGYTFSSYTETTVLKPVYIFLFWQLVIFSVIIFVGGLYLILKNYTSKKTGTKRYVVSIILIILYACLIFGVSFLVYRVFIDWHDIHSWAYRLRLSSHP